MYLLPDFDSRDRISEFTALVEVPPNFCNGPSQEPGEEITLHTWHWVDLPSSFPIASTMGWFNWSVCLPSLRLRASQTSAQVRPSSSPPSPVHISHEQTNDQHGPGDAV